MALTETQKSQVRRFLGYSDRSQGEYSMLEGALVDLSADGEVLVGQFLNDLASIDDELRNSWRLQKAKKAEDVELWGFDQIMSLRSEGNRLAESLGSLLGVRVERPPFSTGNASGQAGRG